MPHKSLEQGDLGEQGTGNKEQGTYVATQIQKSGNTKNTHIGNREHMGNSQGAAGVQGAEPESREQ